MSGGEARVFSRSSLFSCPVYRAKLTLGFVFPRNFSSSLRWLLASAFIG